MMRKSILSLVLFCIAQWCFAQPIITEIKDFRQRKERADSIMNVVHSGVLIIRLNSETKKVKALRDFYSKSKDSNQKKATQKRIDDTIKEREKVNRALVNTFYEHYKSDFLVMYDTANRSLTKGVQSGIFLNQNLELDPSISLADKNYVILGFGKTNYATTHNLIGYIVHDSELVQLEDPFPYFVQIYYEQDYWLDRFLSKFEPSTERKALSFIRKIQK